MKRIRQFLVVVLLALTGLVMWGNIEVGQAHGDTSVSVTPISPKTGEEVTIKGEKLSVNATVMIELTGNNATINLGEAKSDQDGNFTSKFKIPADMKAGTYKLKASADDDTATTELTVLAGSASNTTTASTEGTAAPILERPLWETILLVAFFGVLAGAGIFFAQIRNRKATS